MYRLLISAFLSMVPVVAAAAQVDGMAYRCVMKKSLKRGDWVAPEIMISMHRSGRVHVADAITLGFSREPVYASLTRRKDVITLKWSVTIPSENFVNGLSVYQEEPVVQYKARLNVVKNTIPVLASPPREDYRGSGRCEVFAVQHNG